jgi:hypothetical protein
MTKPQDPMTESDTEISLAFRRCHTAWLTPHHGLNTSRASDAQACLANLVDHHLHLAELLSAEGKNDQAAEALADIHQKLLLFISGTTPERAWSQAALWHIRNTHRALLIHLSEYGLNPAIERALRAGCLSIQLPSTHLH